MDLTDELEFVLLATAIRRDWEDEARLSDWLKDKLPLNEMLIPSRVFHISLTSNV